MDTLPDAYGVGLPIPSRRELQQRRREIFRKEHPLPARESVGFEMALGSRIAWYLRDKGIVNNSQINALRDRALNEWKKDEQVNIWLIVRRISKPRIALNKVLREMHEQGRHKYIEMMFYADGFIHLTRMAEWRDYFASFDSDEKAYKEAESFLRNNAGNDIEKAATSIRAYSIKPPPPVPPAVIAQAPDPARDNAQAAQRLCRDCGGRELISMKTGNWYCPKCNPREENPVTDQPAPVSELDIHIPRCKIHNKPVVDDLTGICEQCEVEARERPKHWSQSTGTFKKVAARFQKRKESATVPDYMAAIKEWFEVESMTQLDMTEEAFYILLDNELAARFDKAQSTKLSETPKNAPISQPSPPTPTTPVSTKIERSSEAKQLNNQPVESGDKKAEIRERYNKPQRGNDYLVVQGRVLLFRLEYPDWTIETEHVLLTEQTAIYKATVRNPEGRVIATGHGRATEAGTKHLGGRYVEKAETSSIGRALALAGFGTDDTLDDEDYLADSPVNRAG